MAFAMLRTLKSRLFLIRRRDVLAVAVMIAVLGWLVAWPAYQRHLAIQEIERLGGAVGRRFDGSEWLMQWDIEFGRVVQVDLRGTTITNDRLQHLFCLKDLQILTLCNTNVSDDGMKHLSGLTDLRGLHLMDTAISDGGLQYLNGLTNLEGLSLDRTHVTDEGVKTLSKSLPNCRIYR